MDGRTVKISHQERYLTLCWRQGDRLSTACYIVFNLSYFVKSIWFSRFTLLVFHIKDVLCCCRDHSQSIQLVIFWSFAAPQRWQTGGVCWLIRNLTNYISIIFLFMIVRWYDHALKSCSTLDGQILLKIKNKNPVPARLVFVWVRSGLNSYLNMLGSISNPRVSSIRWKRIASNQPYLILRQINFE